jgi:ABC-2 type transport system permease protein
MPVMDLGRVPTDVYAGAIRVFFTFVLPIALVATLPSSALLGILAPETALYPLIVAPALLLVSNRFWTYSLRKYSSASS